MRIVELTGTAQVFTLKDGTTFRLFARETKDIANNKISDEMRIAEEMGLVMFLKEVPKKEEVSKTKKTGGVK